jgi:dTDP-glucose pyrophosphorylase
MRKLQIVMPMAGAGSRFAQAGFSLPKPLIPVDGMAMFRVALSSLNGIKADKIFCFVIRHENIDQQLDKLIKEALPEAQIIVIPELTRGAVETAAAALPQLDLQAGLIVMDCDLWFSSQSYNQMVQDSLSGKSEIAGGLLTFDADNPHYSYAKFGADNIVTDVAEKKVISNRAITGAYFFASTQIFSDAAKQLLSRPISDKMPEYYLSLLYNILINEGKTIQAASVDEFASFGTPEELADHQKAHTKH